MTDIHYDEASDAYTIGPLATYSCDGLSIHKRFDSHRNGYRYVLTVYEVSDTAFDGSNPPDIHNKQAQHIVMSEAEMEQLITAYMMLKEGVKPDGA